MKKDLSLPEIALPVFDRLARDAVEGTPGVLIALSGGPDSVALLRLALLWAESGRYPLVAVHINHQLRGDDSDRDEAFCRELCVRHEIPLLVHREDPRPRAAAAGRGLEDAAREMRRDVFARILEDDPRLQHCATGHHRDDQQETILMRLLRGTGPGGLRGIRPLSGVFIHPLLEIPHRRILDWLAELDQPYRCDPTNADGSNTRARVRLEILPLIRDIFGDGAGESLQRLAGLVGRDDTCLQRIAAEARIECATPDGGLSIDRILTLPAAVSSRVLRDQLRECGNSLDDLAEIHIDRLLQWLPDSRSGSRCDLVGGWQAVRSFSELSFRPAAADGPPQARYAVSTRPATADEIRGPLPEAGNLPRPGDVYTLTCPAQNIKGRISLRGWAPGDRIVPFGMAGSRRISDLLREKKVAVDDRERVLIVEDELGPLWVVNLQRAERTRLLPSTVSGITIKVLGNPDIRT